MKKIFVFSLMAAALVACTTTELDPLTGYFPEPTIVEYTSAATCESTTDAEGRRVFTIDLSDGTTPLHLTLIGNKYFLGANQYTEALEAVAKNGNFVIGKTSVGGKNVKQGNIDVAILEEKETETGCENTYSIKTVFFLEDGTPPYKTSWTGKLVFEKDAVLEPQYTYTDTVAADCTDADGNAFTDVESHTLVLTDKAGAFAAQIKLIRKVGVTDLTGTYTVAEYAHEDFTAGNGFDLGVYFGMDPGAYVIGSYYLADGAVMIIDTGATIVVTGMGDGVYSIDGDGFSFLTAPEGFVPGGDSVYDMTDTVAQDCTLEDGATLVEDVESHTLVMKNSADEFVAQFKLVRSLGATDLAGTYTVKEYAHEDFAAGNGFDLGIYFGMGEGEYVIGSYYIADGAIVIIEPGATITVTSEGENTYKFEGEDFSFTGKLTAGDDPGPGPGGDDPEEATLTQFLSLTSYLDYGVNLAGINLATSGITVTPADWEAGIYTDTYAGNGNMLKLEFYTTDGKLAPGTYKACATGGTVGEGEFGIGYDGMFGASGTTWYTITDGTPDAGVYVTDGTLTVSESGGVYTIELASSVVNAKYVGKLEAGGDEPEAPVELTQFLSLTSYLGYGINLAGVNLATPGLTYTPADWAAGIYTDTYGGSGNMLKLEFYTTDGNLAPGTYKACAEGGTVGEGEFGIGYDGMFGASGTTWYTITDGTPDAGVYVTDGTLTVSTEGDVYTIELTSSVVNAKYVGKLSAE